MVSARRLAINGHLPVNAGVSKPNGASWSAIDAAPAETTTLRRLVRLILGGVGWKRVTWKARNFRARKLSLLRATIS